MQSTTLIAFDQHAATTVAAVLGPSQRTPALQSMTSDTGTIVRFVERVRRQGAVQCCYEAGPCGVELQRALTAHEVPCDVIAPALIPRRAGDRVKTNRRDAAQLAILYRAGALTPIHIPTDQEEAARDLLRCREDIRADLLRARRSALEVSPAARPAIHRHEESVVEAARRVAARADVAAAGAGTDAHRVPAHRRRSGRAVARRGRRSAGTPRPGAPAAARRTAAVFPGDR